MKKLFALLFACLMLLSLCACSSAEQGNTEAPETTLPEDTGKTVEQLLADAQDINISTLMNDINDNPVRAKNKYEDGLYLIWGQIYSIKDNYCEISNTYYSHVFRYKVYLPEEELINMNNGEAIQVVGIIGDISTSNGIRYVGVLDAHYVTNIYHIENAQFYSMSYSRTKYNYDAVINDSVLSYIHVELSETQITNAQWNKYEKLRITATGKIVDGVLISDDIVITEP